MNNHRSISSSRSLLGDYAGFISRLLAFMVDMILISISLVAATWFVSVTATMLQFRTILGFSAHAIPGFKAFVDTLFSPAMGSLFSFLFVMGYNVFFWVLAGQTPGKALLGLRVVPLIGGKMSWGRAILRFLGYVPSALLIWLGFLWVIVDDRRQAWHDKLAGTCVIYTWEAHPDESFLAEAIQEIQQH
jgi:uncharacterized RDD family membrane protein YckC